MRWKRRPEGSTWGDFGPDDELGRLNLLTPETVLRGVAEVRLGRAFCLSLPLDYPGGSTLNSRRGPPVLAPTMRKPGRPNMNYPLRCDDPTLIDVMCDDMVTLALQYSTQWDSLAHAGQMFDADGDGVEEDVYYNGFRANEDVVGSVVYGPDGTASPSGGHVGARRLGIENMAASCVQGRGVMIDLLAHFGRTGRSVGYDDLMRAMDADEVVVEPGDFVCFRTGFAAALLEMNRAPDVPLLHATTCALDGRDERLLRWVTDSGAVALIADNYAVERFPPGPCPDMRCALLPLHAHCLFKLGCYLGELWDLTALADWLREHGRTRFLLTAPPLRLPGAVGSPVTPVATV